MSKETRYRAKYRVLSKSTNALRIAFKLRNTVFGHSPLKYTKLNRDQNF
jgi:hypothetical protein